MRTMSLKFKHMSVFHESYNDKKEDCFDKDRKFVIGYFGNTNAQ